MWISLLRKRALPFLGGAAITLCVVAYLEGVRSLGMTPPIPFLLLFATVVLVAALFGTTWGVGSATVVSAYILYAASVAFGPHTLTGGPLQVGFGMGLHFAAALFLGHLRDQNRRLLREARRLQASLEERLQQRTEHLKESNTQLQHSLDEHRHTIVQLETTQELLDVAFRISPFGIAVCRLRDGAILDVNNRFLAMTGLRREEALGQTLARLEAWTHPGDHQKIQAVFEREGKVEQMELSFRHTSGEVRTVLLSAGPMRYEGTHCVLVTLLDITDRKQAERQLQERETQLQKILQTTLDGYILADDQGRIIEVNPAYCRMTGYTRAELLGTNIRDREAALLPEEVTRRIQEMIARGGARFITRHRCKDGRILDLDASIVMLPTPRPLFAAFVRDITEKLRTEAALRESQQRYRALYEEMLEARNRLARLSRNLVEAQERERRNIAMELHDEAGQQLTALKLILDTLDLEAAPNLAEPLTQAREIVQALSAGIRSLSLDLRPAMLDDLGLLPTLVWYFNRFTEQTCIDVHFRQSGLEGQRFPQPVETTTYRVIQEALTNVARHAGVKEVSVTIWTNDLQLEIEIRDKGVGFTYQPQETGRSSGLSGMRERVELLDGTFSVTSDPGAGTRLYIVLPVEPAYAPV